MKILFIGNSYTYFNDMPKILERICRENDIDLATDSVVKGGYTLAHFLSLDNEYGVRAHALLSSEKYDYVVLQEQSVRPAEHPETFYNSVRELAALIRENGAKLVLYETWARADGSETLDALGWSHDTMREKLKKAYENAAKENNAILVYAGERFDEAYKAGEPVYDPDKSHPSPTGTKIVAEEFFRTLMNKT